MLSESLKGVNAQVLLKKVGGRRLPAREILITKAAVSSFIREGKTFQLMSIIQTNKKLGITLNESLCELVDKKLVDPEEAYLKSGGQGFDGNDADATRHQIGFQEIVRALEFSNRAV